MAVKLSAAYQLKIEKLKGAKRVERMKMEEIKKNVDYVTEFAAARHLPVAVGGFY